MKVGAAKVDITPELSKPLPLLGWGDPRHQARSISLPIHVRTVVFQDDAGAKLAFVCVEICFISESLRLGVMKGLKTPPVDLAHERPFDDHEVVLTATHTHNAPGGYCHSILYNIPSKGYHPEIFKTYVNGILSSIFDAFRAIRPAVLTSGTLEIPLHEEVAFNRSIRAYNQNRDVESIPENRPERAVSRTMDGISAYDESGSLIAHVNWFPVHCTSVHRDVHAIHPDHKGIASKVLEDEFSKDGAIVIFAQGAAGDVSPNFKKYWFKRETRGRFRDDLKSAEFTAGIQVKYAKKLLQSAVVLNPSSGSKSEIDSILAYHDCTSIPIPPEWVGGREGVRTGPAALGCPFMAGTDEGRGAPRMIVALAGWILKLLYFARGRRLKQSVHGNKIICVELSEGRVFGDSRPADLPIPSWLDPLMGVIRFWSRIRVFRGEAMSPTRMPVQLFRIRDICFAAVPGEFT
ncbi:MAG: neutral/alkaline non-lysosomal ceramidase N-terminal domain-containing protein, partial [Bdellovibrionales bacterium]|nr:neutral/alkaline non-lysosomal ceramidase N-terminal domain-containing protein [Bdellovibrionales bacterium]